MERQVKTVAVDTHRLWISRKAAAEYLGVSKSWLEDREADGMLSVSKVGNTFFYIKSQIDKMIRDGAITGRNNFRDTR